ncbi:AMP-binding protein [bacterium]|nr:AMP-binding protein [bacterium]
MRKITFFQHAINILGSKREAQSLVDMFGYYSEMKEMNAYDAYVTFKTDFGNIQYYVLKEGLSELCIKMKNEILNNGGKVHLKTTVTNVEHTSKGFYIGTSNRPVSAERVIFALKPYQLREFKILKDVHSLSASVYEAPLIRIYAQYPKPLWFDGVYRSTTNNKLRQIIPINNEKGLPLTFVRSCSASLPAQVYQDAMKKYATCVLEAYAMTEASHQMTSNPLGGESKVRSVGLPTGILDTEGVSLGGHQEGEVCIRGSSVTQGYMNNNKANLIAFAFGWFHTGDLGYLDSDGYLFLVGRLKEMINRGGEKISPLEIDDVLQSCPLVEKQWHLVLRTSSLASR